MKKLLILLLIVGCDNSTESENSIGLPQSYPFINNQVSIFEHRLYDNSDNYINDIPDSTYYDTLIIKVNQVDYFIMEWNRGDSVSNPFFKNEDGRVLLSGLYENKGSHIWYDKPDVWADFNTTVVFDTSKYNYGFWKNDSTHTFERTISEIEFDGSVYQSYKFNSSEVSPIPCSYRGKLKAITEFSKLGFHNNSYTYTCLDSCEGECTEYFERRILIKYYNLEE